MRLAFLLLTLPLSAEVLRESRPLMGTRFTIVCHPENASNAHEAIDRAFKKAATIEKIASDYRPDSELNHLSKAPANKAVKVSPTLYELLVAARNTAEWTDGCYDPTLGKLSRMWRVARDERKLPDTELLKSGRSSIGWKSYELDPDSRSVIRRKPTMGFDLGGIAKGYAADAMFEIMSSYGISRTSITAGGDIRLGDPPPERKGWRVAVKTFDKNQPDEILILANCGISTSGDLYQFVEIDGVRYSHILDPETGLGLSRPIAVTVIAPSATLSDPLATAACVAGPEDAPEMLRNSGATDFRIRIQVPESQSGDDE